jgi:hypothetical protein
VAAAAAQGVVCVSICCLAVACTSQGSGAGDRPRAAPVVRLTGYRSVSLFGSSGAITVTLGQADFHDIQGLLSALPSGSRPHCEEPLGLVYRVTVERAPGFVRGTVISGYRCGGAVSVAIPGSGLSWRTDAECRLVRAVRRLAPSRAEGTRLATVGCA